MAMSGRMRGRRKMTSRLSDQISGFPSIQTIIYNNNAKALSIDILCLVYKYF